MAFVGQQSCGQGSIRSFKRGRSGQFTSRGRGFIQRNYQGRHLHNVLVVTEIKKSLLCISQITTEHAYLFEFTCDGFGIKHIIYFTYGLLKIFKKPLYYSKPHLYFT